MNASELRRRRLALGWSREQLAANLGVAEKIVARWEESRIPADAVGAVDRLLRGFEWNSPPMIHVKKRSATG